MMAEPEFRVGGKQPGNVYRNNERFAFTKVGADGQLLADALNAFAPPSFNPAGYRRRAGSRAILEFIADDAGNVFRWNDRFAFTVQDNDAPFVAAALNAFSPEHASGSGDQPLTDALAVRIRSELHQANPMHASTVPVDQCVVCTGTARVAAHAIGRWAAAEQTTEVLREQIAEAVKGHTWQYDEHPARLAALVDGIISRISWVSDLVRERASLREQLAEAVQMVKVCTGHPDTEVPAHADLIAAARRERDAVADEISRLRFFLAGSLSLSANQVLSMSTMDMLTALAHERDRAREALDYGRPVAQEATAPARPLHTEWIASLANWLHENTECDDDYPNGEECCGSCWSFAEKVAREFNRVTEGWLEVDDAPVVAQEAGEPPVARVWRKGDPEPPADVRLLLVEPGAPGEAYLKRTPNGNWCFVQNHDDETDPDGWAWELTFAVDSDEAVERLTEVIEGGDY